MWVNEQGRFAQGIVPPSQKNALLAELDHYLTLHRDKATGKPIIARTYRGEDLYDGPFADQGPDLVIEYNNLHDPEAATHPNNPFLEGGHTPNGIFLAHGPNIQSTHLEPANLIDLAPTILHLFGQPIPPDMDGRVLIDIFTPAYREEHPIQTGTEPAYHTADHSNNGYTETEEAEIKAQLRQLGYID